MEREEPRAEAALSGDAAVVSDEGMRRELALRGYGEETPKGLVLRPYESLYLLYCGRLRLAGPRGPVDFGAMMRAARRRDGEALTRFLVYRDLRSRGYAVKDGFGFGTDFRVYERGQFGQKGARYVVFALSEGARERVGQLQRKAAQITQMGKEPIVAVVERRGEVIYYKLSRVEFPQNRAAGGGPPPGL